jgi:hypothetical protein
MAGHALRGMVTAWLGLVVLQTVSTKGGSGRVAGLFGDVDRLIQRAFDPKVPAIPDRRGGANTHPVAVFTPMATGQTSSDGSSGHNYSIGGNPAVPTSPLVPPGGTGGRSFHI